MTKSQRDYTRDYWFRFYPVRYNSSTLLLQPLADCAYRRLLDRYMIDGSPPPDNDRAIARIIGYSLDEWLAVRPEVHPYFKRRKVAGDWVLIHEDAEAEIAWQRNRSGIAREKGKSGAEARHRKSNGLDSTGTQDPRPQPPPVDARGDEIRREEESTEFNLNIETNPASPREGSRPPAPEAKTGKAKRDGKPKTRLPLGWDPGDEGRSVAREEGLDFDRILAKFRDWALGSGILKADWLATFRNWCRSENDRFGRGNRQVGRDSRPQGPAGITSAVFDALAAGAGKRRF